MLDGEDQCKWLIEGVLLTIPLAEKDFLVNSYFKKELRIYYTISMKWDQRRAMVTSGLGSVLVYVEKTPVSSFSSKGDICLAVPSPSRPGFFLFRKKKDGTGGEKTLSQTL